MARLLACPSCRRHVQASEQDCPFCGQMLSVGPTTSTTSALSVLLLGLCLVGCTSSTDDAKKSEPEKAKINVPPAPEPAPPEPEPAPTTAIAPEPPPIEPPPEPASTTAIEPPPVEGTDAGATIDDPPPAIEDMPEPKPKYGAPRPQKKYGAPPKPDDMGI
jgi:hypothetical protein